MSEAVPEFAKDLIGRLPRTFGPALKDQFQQWDLLFPAEQRALKAQLKWLDELPRDEFQTLFAPIIAIESKMELPAWQPGTVGLSVRDAGLLARSPLYPKWRGEVEKVFTQVDDAVEKSGALPRPPRFLLCLLPAGVPLETQPLWPELAKHGTWAKLDAPFGQMLSPLAKALAERKAAPGLEPIESTWVFECDTRLSPLAETSRATVLSWAALAGARREFSSKLNSIRRDLHSVDSTNEDLRRIDMRKLLSEPVASEPRVREFVRSLLLSGNGSLIFDNSFIQWGSTEALRRAQPQVMLSCFGIRQKIKPFSGSVLFEDQKRSNPVPDQEDPAGSLVDALMLSEYVYLGSERLIPYREHTLTLMAAADLNRVLMLGPRSMPAVPVSFNEGQLTAFTLDWLQSAR